MNKEYTVSRRKMAAVTVVASVALFLVGCGADKQPQADKPTTPTAAPQKTQGGHGGQTAETPAEPLALLKGRKGLTLVIGSVERDAGGFLTVKGRLTNAGESGSAVPAQVSGDETEVVKHGTSLGGATLVDSVGRKRYYVLRDTDGRPLTTSGLGVVSAGDSIDIFMQFPAPPTTTTEVSFQLPTFEPATLKLS
ncbi:MULTISPECIES: hypothetical protein [unclassified Streptomyces]|uniref:hypothetical protein n=1 Tax=unclassified Streptomyces TaxID=2593676 RepID=UPI0006F1E2AA|nr:MULTISPECIES: hypothetical protein [unclassified Streptomyces]KQX58890.1 hypothetical protein ASD33_00830 [Streptomyces sp. Root1304]KRB00151.1 hypothetical protein ASE09_00830 [Streptomyces sp. Root66D1]